MKAWDRHCPECGSDDRELLHVAPTRLRRRCNDCGHTWSEEKDPDPRHARRENYVHIDSI